MNIFTGFIPPIYFIPPQYKNFLVPLKLQIRETYLQTYCTVEHPQTLDMKHEFKNTLLEAQTLKFTKSIQVQDYGQADLPET